MGDSWTTLSSEIYFSCFSTALFHLVACCWETPPGSVTGSQAGALILHVTSFGSRAGWASEKTAICPLCSGSSVGVISLFVNGMEKDLDSKVLCVWSPHTPSEPQSLRLYYLTCCHRCSPGRRSHESVAGPQEGGQTGPFRWSQSGLACLSCR